MNDLKINKKHPKKRYLCTDTQPNYLMRNRFMKAFLPLFIVLFFAVNTGMAASGETKVWIVQSSSSQCYHIDKNCRTWKSAKNPIKSVTLQEAKKMGKRPCKVCSK